MYDVYLTCIDEDDEQVFHVLKERDRNTWNTIQDQNLIFSREQWTKESNENKSWTKDEWKSINNNKIMHEITGTRALYTT